MRQQPELTVEEVPTDELVPYARNAKVHTNEQIDQIVKSIEEFGFNDPIAVWHNEEGAMEIIEGHGRVLAAKKLGLDVLPVVTLDHLTNDQRRAYTHVHNQLTMNTGLSNGGKLRKPGCPMRVPDKARHIRRLLSRLPLLLRKEQARHSSG